MTHNTTSPQIMQAPCDEKIDRWQEKLDEALQNGNPKAFSSWPRKKEATKAVDDPKTTVEQLQNLILAWTRFQRDYLKSVEAKQKKTTPVQVEDEDRIEEDEDPRLRKATNRVAERAKEEARKPEPKPEPERERRAKPDKGPAPVKVLLQRHGMDGYDLDSIEENYTWHNNLPCPRCGAPKLSVRIRPEGTGGWMCHAGKDEEDEEDRCGFRSRKGEVIGWKKYNAQMGEEAKDTENQAVSLLKRLTPEVRKRLTGTADRGEVLKDLVYWAEKVKWREFYKTDAELAAEAGVHVSTVYRTKKWLERQTSWARVRKGGIGNKTWYRFIPDPLELVLDGVETSEGVTTEKAEQAERKAREVE